MSQICFCMAFVKDTIKTVLVAIYFGSKIVLG
jgi:hypothetical protein